jgi:hypothetical protein
MYDICRVPDCNYVSKAKKKGLCYKHNSRHNDYHKDKTAEEFIIYCIETDSLLVETCLLSHCGLKTLSKGLCSKHYNRYYRNYKNKITVREYIDLHE